MGRECTLSLLEQMKKRWLLVLIFSGLCHIFFFNADHLGGRALGGLFIGMYVLPSMTLFLIMNEIPLVFSRAVVSVRRMLSLHKLF